MRIYNSVRQLAQVGDPHSAENIRAISNVNRVIEMLGGIFLAGTNVFELENPKDNRVTYQLVAIETSIQLLRISDGKAEVFFNENSYNHEKVGLIAADIFNGTLLQALESHEQDLKGQPLRQLKQLIAALRCEQRVEPFR